MLVVVLAAFCVMSAVTAQDSGCLARGRPAVTLRPELHIRG